jgi:hypothetical protein
MESNTMPANEVLHSESHEKLTPEEIAKAVARHNKHHSAAKAGAGAGTATAKEKKAKKK